MSKAPDRYPSPLRYPGGKGKIGNYIKLLILENSLEGIHYVEPYAGGASVAVSLLLEGYVSGIQINDLNEGVYNFWRLLKEDPDLLCAKIIEVPLSISEWTRQKRIYSDPHASPDDLGFATFYLNRTNRSGIIARGGPIGGTRQEGEWKIDARFNRLELCARVNRISAMADRLHVSNQDAAQLVNQYARRDAMSSFLYLDPPYYVKGSGLYDNSYSHHDHVRIAEKISELNQKWIVSYDATPEILDLYSSFVQVKYNLSYSASTTSSGSEVMIFCNQLHPPNVEGVAGISFKQVSSTRKRLAQTGLPMSLLQ